MQSTQKRDGVETKRDEVETKAVGSGCSWGTASAWVPAAALIIRQGQGQQQRHTSIKSQYTGRISVDRSTRATLSTYNTWKQLSRLQKIYRVRHAKLRSVQQASSGVADS